MGIGVLLDLSRRQLWVPPKKRVLNNKETRNRIFGAIDTMEMNHKGKHESLNR